MISIASDLQHRTNHTISCHDVDAVPYDGKRKIASIIVTSRYHVQSFYPYSDRLKTRGMFSRIGDRCFA